MKEKLFVFSDTVEAYDACNCDSEVKTGDTILIPSEGVVGLAWTWPVAVTTTCGSLHAASIPICQLKSRGIPVFSQEQIDLAESMATSMGFTLR